jgi:hypothetical protein
MLSRSECLEIEQDRLQQLIDDARRKKERENDELAARLKVTLTTWMRDAHHK